MLGTDRISRPPGPEQPRQPPHHRPGIRHVLEHVEAQHEVERAGRDLRLERRLRRIASPDAIEARLGAFRDLVDELDPARPFDAARIPHRRSRRAGAAADIEQTHDPLGQPGQDLPAGRVVVTVAHPRPVTMLGARLTGFRQQSERFIPAARHPPSRSRREFPRSSAELARPGPRDPASPIGRDSPLGLQRRRIQLRTSEDPVPGNRRATHHRPLLLDRRPGRDLPRRQSPHRLGDDLPVRQPAGPVAARHRTRALACDAGRRRDRQRRVDRLGRGRPVGRARSATAR